MGKTTDFLFQGQKPPNVSSSSVQTTQVPAYLQQYHEGILARGNAIAAQPYQTYGGQRLADTAPALQQGWAQGMQSANSYQPYFQSAGAQIDKAAGGSAAGAAQPYINQAMGLSGTAAAQPGLNAAMQTSASQVNGYMSPYLTGVVDQIARKGQESLQMGLHTLGDDFIRGGQLSSSRHQSAAGKAYSDATTAITDAQTRALDQGFNTALGAAQNDLSRFAQVGQAQGNLANAEQQNIANIGQMAGNFSSVDTRNALDTSTAYQGLGKNTQSAGLTGAAAMEAVGRGQMADQQRSLDLAYQDFQDQREYPRNNVDWMASLTKGQPSMGSSVYSDSNRPAQQSELGPSGLGMIAGSLSLASGLGSLFKAKGGRVTDEQKREPVGPGLSMLDAPRRGPEMGPGLTMAKRRPAPIRVPRRAA